MSSISGVDNGANISTRANINSKIAGDSAAQQATVSHTPEPVANATSTGTTVVLSTAAHDKLAAEQGAAKVADSSEGETAKVANAESDDGDLESFAFGALGLDHPDHIDENSDSSYSAGQYVKAVATIGGMIAMFI
ncbi:hypothetical protein FM038_017390 [Shewanella eurypsychrophilus]|uniref:Uncharacterized protein n=1 Tax=Shewanella eurypsychrophilus TaxID=2593656 RepID=A0ABX6V8I4_9GAMM|nr:MULTISPECIES: hypothetical protein [Shewanella]QFU23770.1 hypothetical protein FS418_19170 [Shewanella sp. YLB-09]QPG58993.1 hypothetical protein FM038_017390 [Shewanella eurypsychrophilus]